MRTLGSFIKKEFLHILRDPLSLLMMCLFPLVQMAVLSYAVSTEIKHIPFVVMDEAQSADSRALVEKLRGNAYFEWVGEVKGPGELEGAFRKGLCAMGVVFPPGFGGEPLRGDVLEVQVLVDASDPNQAAAMANYLQAEVMDHLRAGGQAKEPGSGIVTEVKMLYNPQLLSSFSIVPGLQGMVLLLICATMTSIAVVREKELGTMEVLLVSPLRPRVIIIAKAIPYVLVSLVDVALILVLSNVAIGVPIRGNLALLLAFSLVYIFTSLSIGMLISTIAETQQTAMIAAGVGLMLPAILLSGLVFPVESMPGALRVLSHVVPARWFIEALRDVMIKGLGFEAVWRQFLILSGMCAFFTVVSIKKFKNKL
ncbi:MAG: ABC transporter permease [Tannerellaceae bacterium]|jgi:ABC-2 type transport system permease protein|nr:ABC transporter permease [Tannerellaceae bacterium]